MKMTTQQLQEITLGAAWLVPEADGIRFSRFTQQQEEVYKAYDVDLYHNAMASADIRLSFRTDSPWLELEGWFLRPSKVTRGVLDVKINGVVTEMIASPDDESVAEKAEGERPDQLDVKTQNRDRSAFARRISLGEGMKTVQIYLSWCKPTVLRRVELADGCILEPVRPRKKLLVFGDSLTQGYYVDRNIQTWLHKLADALEAEVCSKAVGGEVHFPQLAWCKDPMEPDYILSAYGTNDWTRTTKETFGQNVPDFYNALQTHYPKAKIITLLPIRNPCEEEIRKWGVLEELRQELAHIAGAYPNVSVVNCYEMNSRDPRHISAGSHPDAEGYDIYVRNLIPAVCRALGQE